MKIVIAKLSLLRMLIFRLIKVIFYRISKVNISALLDFTLLRHTARCRLLSPMSHYASEIEDRELEIRIRPVE